MSRGGFKAFCVDVNGISGGGTISDVENVLSQITKGIVDTAQGWKFATTTPSENDFINVTDNGRAQFLTHTNGAKLCVAMCISSGTTSSFNLASCYNPENTSNYDGVISGGLCMSMIPPGMGDYNIDQIMTTNFMPTTAFRLLGFGSSWSATYYPKCFVERSDMDGKVLRYMIIVRNDCILAACRRTDMLTSCAFYAIGNILNCINSTDTNTFATFLPYQKYASVSEGDTSLLSFDNTQDSSVAITANSYGNAQFYAQDGGLLSASKSFYTSGTTAVNAIALISRSANTYVCTFNSNYRRFVPFNVFMRPASTDYSGGVIPYDYYKGIINPEVMCQIYHESTAGLSVGALLDNGNYMHLCNGVIVGWDSSNTANFWGL